MDAHLALPLELFRCIFEEAARDDVRSGLALMLVSRLVNNWIRPILYEIALLRNADTAQRFLATLTGPHDDFRHHVRFLAFGVKVAPTSAMPIVEQCDQVRDLCLLNFFPPNPTSITSGTILGSLPLQRLHCDPLFFDVLKNLPHTPTWFLHLTHLHLRCTLGGRGMSNIDFTSFPNLSHFAIRKPLELSSSNERAKQTMNGIPNLELLVLKAFVRDITRIFQEYQDLDGRTPWEGGVIEFLHRVTKSSLGRTKPRVLIVLSEPYTHSGVDELLGGATRFWETASALANRGEERVTIVRWLRGKPAQVSWEHMK